MKGTETTDHAKRILGFFIVPAFSTLSSLLLLPLITRSFGAEGLSSLAVGSGIGALAGVAVGLLWPLVGGYMVGSTPDDERRQDIYAESLMSRGVAAIVIVPLACAAALVLAHADHVATTLFTISVAANGFTASWYFAGVGAPLKLVRNEALPRVASYAVAALGIFMGAQLWFYGAAMIAASACSYLLNWSTAMPRRGGWSWRRGADVAIAHAKGTCVRVFQSSYTYLRAPIYAYITPTGLALFSASEQLQGAAGNASAALPAGLMKLVSQDSSPYRRRGAYAVCAAAAALGLFAWEALSPSLMKLLFSGTIIFSRAEQQAIGIAIVSTFLVRCFEQLVLIPSGRRRLVYENNVITAAIGLAVLVATVVFGGLTAAIFGVAFTATMAGLHYAVRSFAGGW